MEGKAINLGTGREVSIGELATRIIALADVDPVLVSSSPQRLRPKTSEVERLLAESVTCTEASGLVGADGLRRRLRQTLDWLRSLIESYKPSIENV